MDGFVPRRGLLQQAERRGRQGPRLGSEAEQGSFTGDFEDKTRASVRRGLDQQGADIIFPVAGPAGLGGLQAAQASDVYGIWVDTDGCVSAAEYCDSLLTSVMKNMDVAVETRSRPVDGSFSNEPYVGTLENDGIGLAPFNEFDSKVPPELKYEIDELKAQLISGEIKID